MRPYVWQFLGFVIASIVGGIIAGYSYDYFQRHYPLPEREDVS